MMLLGFIVFWVGNKSKNLKLESWKLIFESWNLKLESWNLKLESWKLILIGTRRKWKQSHNHSRAWLPLLLTLIQSPENLLLVKSPIQMILHDPVSHSPCSLAHSPVTKSLKSVSLNIPCSCARSRQAPSAHKPLPCHIITQELDSQSFFLLWNVQTSFLCL